METIAVYWEERIKIYGISTKHGLTLLSLFPVDVSATGIAGMCSSLSSFLPEFVLSAYQQGAKPRFDIVTPREMGNEASVRVRQVRDKLKNVAVTVIDDVSMISLHGPHFQDRFGIAEVAVKALTVARIPMLLHVCAGTSLQLIVPEYSCKQTCDILRQTFVIPTSV